ncbi:MAG: hypothetical protein ACO27C_04290 [Candidatus Limnocylindrus sp.]
MATVREYLDALPAKEAKSLRRVRDAALAAGPGGRAAISYGVIGIVFPNGARIHCGARRGGLSLYPGHTGREFAAELADFKIAGTTIHFTPDHELPITLIKRITKAIIRKADERAAVRGRTRRR